MLNFIARMDDCFSYAIKIFEDTRFVLSRRICELSLRIRITGCFTKKFLLILTVFTYACPMLNYIPYVHYVESDNLNVLPFHLYLLLQHLSDFLRSFGHCFGLRRPAAWKCPASSSGHLRYPWWAHTWRLHIRNIYTSS